MGTRRGLSYAELHRAAGVLFRSCPSTVGIVAIFEDGPASSNRTQEKASGISSARSTEPGVQLK